MSDSRKHFLIPHAPTFRAVTHFHGVVFTVLLVNSPSRNGATGCFNNLGNFNSGRIHLGLFVHFKGQIHEPCKERDEIIFAV
jgi:hypothetical protein